MKKILVTSILLLIAISVHATVIVQWSSPTPGAGETDIVTTSQSAATANKTQTWQWQTNCNPVVGTSYYPNATGRSPTFFTAGSAPRINQNISVEQATSGDRIMNYCSQPTNGATYSAMTMWKTFLDTTPGNTVSSMTMNAGMRMTNETASVRFLVMQESSYYASQSFNINSATATNVISGIAAAMTWYNFTPFVNGVETVGSVATVDLTDVEAVGFYFIATRLNADSAVSQNNQLGLNTSYFGVTAESVSGPQTFLLTVNNGTGDGSYTNGHQAVIEADVPPGGQIFNQWTGDTAFVANSNSANTTVTMPAQAVTLTATYKTAQTANGTPYTWLAGYGLTNYTADDVLDQDIDGMKTWQEYIAGTDPLDPDSCLKVAQNTRDIISWVSQSNRVYSVYWSTNLASGFQGLSTNILYPQNSYTNTAPDPRADYYQVRVQLQ